MGVPTLGSLAVALVVLGLVFLGIESISPATPSQPRWRRDTRTDLAHWFFTPLLTKGFSLIAFIAALAGVPLDREHLEAFMQRPSWLSSLPTALQVLAALFLGDLLAYSSHHLFHRGRLWAFHAVHHSPKRLDWLSSVRLHPLNEGGGTLMAGSPVLRVVQRKHAAEARLGNHLYPPRIHTNCG